LLRIVQIAAPTVAGGLERVVEALAVGHHRRGHDVTVATLMFGTRQDHPFVQTLEREGVHVHPIRLTHRAYLGERREIARLCRDLRPDIVHTHGYRIDLLDRGVARRHGIPVVTTVHGPSMMGGLKGAFFEWLQRMNYRRFDAVVAVSAPLLEATVADGVSPDRAHLVPNGWSGLREPLGREAARHELGIDAGEQVLGWVGRLIPVKGCDIFLDAVSRLPEPRPLCVVIGYGPERDRLIQRAGLLGIDSRIRVHSEISDAARYFRAFDAYVLSSRSEGLPLVLLEAMAAETPIVATKVGGVMDAVGEAEALLVPPADPGALAAAIAHSLGNRAEASRRACRASERLAKAFSLELFLDRYEQVYEAAIQARSASKRDG
jgi:glycosyltransferase involved in cell wall biosynthesis